MTDQGNDEAARFARCLYAVVAHLADKNVDRYFSAAFRLHRRRNPRFELS